MSTPGTVNLSCSLALIAFLFGGSTAFPSSSTNSVLAWPPPPDEARVAYVRDISNPSDVGAKPSVLTRLANLITGVDRARISLDKPFGLAIGDRGELLVTDTGSKTVCLIDIERKKWSRWDSADKTRFSSPVAAVRHGQTIFVADSALGKVLALDEKGRLQLVISEELSRPSGLALFKEKLVVADSQRHQVVVFDLKGHLLTKFGKRGTSPGEFNFPTHIAVDLKGRLYVTDSLNFRIQVFDANGQFLRSFGGAGDGPGYFSRPKGVAADRFGHVYVIDGLFDNVQVFDETGGLLMNWGEPGQSPGQFWLPNAIAISKSGEIYVTDSYNHRIQVFRYLGKE